MMRSCLARCFDARCPDGCCGEVGLLVKSPRTGAVCEVNYYDLPARVRSEVYSALSEAADGEAGGWTPALFSLEELGVMAKKGYVSRRAA